MKLIQWNGFLKDWLKNHIPGPDKKYGLFLNSESVF